MAPRTGSRAPRGLRAPDSPDLLDALQAEVLRLKKRGIEWPFVHVDLRKWAPTWARADSYDADTVSDVSKDIRDLAKAQRAFSGGPAAHRLRARARKWLA